MTTTITPEVGAAIGALVTVITILWRLHLSADATIRESYEARLRERDEREDIIVAERDDWRARAAAADARLAAFTGTLTRANEQAVK